MPLKAVHLQMQLVLMPCGMTQQGQQGVHAQQSLARVHWAFDAMPCMCPSHAAQVTPGSQETPQQATCMLASPASSTDDRPYFLGS